MAEIISHMMPSPTGVGKSTEARKIVKPILDDTPGKTVVFAIPDHTLGNEAAEALREELRGTDYTVDTYRGRSADDPLNVGEKMCRKHKLAGKIGRLGGDVPSQLCGNPEEPKKGLCEHRKSCPYIAQQSQKANVWFVPHTMLTQGKPSCIGTVGAVFVDENALKVFMGGLGSTPVTASREDLLIVADGLESKAVQVRKDAPRDADRAREITYTVCIAKDYTEDAADRESQSAYDETFAKQIARADRGEALALKIRDLRDRIEAQPNGVVSTVLADNYDQLSPLWELQKELKIGPSSKDERVESEMARVGEWNGRVRRVRRLLKCISDGAHANWRARETVGGEDFAEIIPGLRHEDGVISMTWLKQRAKGWHAPTMYMDATAPTAAMRALFPDIQHVHEIDCATPHMTVRQVRDWNASRQKLYADEDSDDARKRTAANNQKLVSWMIERNAAQFRGKGGLVGDKRVDVLVLTYKATREALEAMGLPSNVEIAHYGKLVGLDRWKNVACIMDVGGASARVDAVEAIAELLKSTTLDPLTGDNAMGSTTWFDTRKIGGRRRGSDMGPLLERTSHPDVLAESVRWAAVEGQLLQGIGRGRAVRRGPQNPLHLDLITNVPLPLEVDEYVDWAEYQVTPVELMAARGVEITSAAGSRGYWNVVAAALPDWFGTPKAAEMYFKQNRVLISLGTIKDLYIAPKEISTSADGTQNAAPPTGTARVKAGARGWIEIAYTADADLPTLFAGCELEIVTVPPVKTPRTPLPLPSQIPLPPAWQIRLSHAALVTALAKWEPPPVFDA